MTHAENYLSDLLTTHGDVREPYIRAQSRVRGFSVEALDAARARLGIWTYVQYGEVYWGLRERKKTYGLLPQILPRS